MVVAENEFVPAAEGFESPASDAMPFPADEQMAFDSDSAGPSGETGFESTATDSDDPLSAYELPSEERERISTYYRQQAEAALREKYDNDFSELRSTKDREVAKALLERDEAAAAAQLTMQQMGRLIAEYVSGQREPGKHDFLEFKEALRGALTANRSKKRQAAQSISQWEQESRGRMQAELERASRDQSGNLLVDLTKDAELSGIAEKMFQAARAGNQDENERLYREHVRLVAEKRAAAILNGARPDTRQQAANRQQTRGRQLVARGGAPAAPPTIKDMIAAVQREQPALSYADAHREAIMRLAQ